jgi:hypothetical protein
VLSLFVIVALSNLAAMAPLRAAILNGAPITSEVQLLSELTIGSEFEAKVTLWNRSGDVAQIIGQSKSCSCITLAETLYGRTIPAYEHISIPVSIRPNKLGSLHQRVTVFLSHSKQFRVNVDIIGQVFGETK